MAVQSAEDNVASRLASSIADSYDSLDINNELTGLIVPDEGWLVLGSPRDLLPSSNGEPPTGEVVFYESFTRNGDGTSTFGTLTRGIRNTNAQGWDAGTPVGLAQSAEYINLILDAITPQDDGNYIFQNIHSSSEINTALQPGGVNELDIRDWYEKALSGIVNSGDVGNLVTTNVPDGESISVTLATLIESDGHPVDTGVDLVIATLDNSGNGDRKTVVLEGDGSSVYDRQTGSPIASYSNTSGSSKTVMIGVDNGHFNAGSGSEQELYVAVVAKVT